jgi:hypothetical protein
MIARVCDGYFSATVGGYPKRQRVLTWACLAPLARATTCPHGRRVSLAVGIGRYRAIAIRQGHPAIWAEGLRLADPAGKGHAPRLSGAGDRKRKSD